MTFLKTVPLWIWLALVAAASITYALIIRRSLQDAKAALEAARLSAARLRLLHAKTTEAKAKAAAEKREAAAAEAARVLAARSLAAEERGRILAEMEEAAKAETAADAWNGRQR